MKFDTYKQGDGVANELGVLLDNFLNPLLLNVLRLVLLQVQDDLCSAANGLACKQLYSHEQILSKENVMSGVSLN